MPPPATCRLRLLLLLLPLPLPPPPPTPPPHHQNVTYLRCTYDAPVSPNVPTALHSAPQRACAPLATIAQPSAGLHRRRCYRARPPSTDPTMPACPSLLPRRVHPPLAMVSANVARRPGAHTSLQHSSACFVLTRLPVSRPGVSCTATLYTGTAPPPPAQHSFPSVARQPSRQRHHRLVAHAQSDVHPGPSALSVSPLAACMNLHCQRITPPIARPPAHAPPSTSPNCSSLFPVG